MWTTTNYKGKEQIWYSKEEYKELEEKYIKALRKLGTKIKEKEDENKRVGYDINSSK